MKMLIEHVENVEYLFEETNGQKNLHIHGIFLQSEIKNRNGRFYPKHIMEREVERYRNEKINNKCAWGELSHPESPQINLERVSHLITNLTQEGNNWIGKARILSEGNGKIVKALIESGGRIGVSSRGLGTWKLQNECKMIQDDYHLATAADIVADPSAPDAFTSAIMEHKDWVWDNGMIQESSIDRIYQEVKAANKRNLEEATLKAFKDFLGKL